MKINISNLEKKIKIKLSNKSLLIIALTHKSANSENNNEKLEFLGDRVLGLALSKKLFNLYPEEDEGVLDKRFSKLVYRQTCASVAWSIGIKDFVILGDQKKLITYEDEKILSDTCEALIGAIYVDKGFDYAEKFILRLWKKEIGKSSITILDSKTKLQEYTLKLYKKLPIYRLLSFKGPKHNPEFKISVEIPGKKNFIGHGKSKQEAEQNAASNLLKNININ